MIPSPVDPHDWIDESAFGEQLTLSLIRSQDPAAVLRAFAGGDPFTLHQGVPGPDGDLLDMVDAPDLADDDRSTIWALARDGWVVVTEPGTFRGEEEAVARRVAAPRHATVTWHINGGERFTLFEDGEMVTTVGLVDVLLWEDSRNGPVADWLDDVPADDDEDAETPSPRALGLLLLERATGVTVVPDDLTAEQWLATVGGDDAPSTLGTWWSPGSGEVTAQEALPGLRSESGSEPHDASMPYLVLGEDDDGDDEIRGDGQGEEPDGWLGAMVPVEAVLVRTEQVVARLTTLRAYPAGMSLVLELRTPHELTPQWHPYEPVAGGRLPRGLIRFDVRYADGSRASSLADADGLTLVATASTGSLHAEARTFWLRPLPPPGPVTFSLVWPAAGITEAVSCTVDGESIRDAAARAEPLPWAT